MPTRPKGRLMVILLVLLSTALAMCILLAGISSSLPWNISSTAQKLQSMPTPAFVLKTDYQAKAPEGYICTTISQETLWSPENPYTDWSKNIENSLSVTIDDWKLSKDDINIKQWNGIGYVFGDKKIIGSYGDWRERCLRTGYLLPGQHIATIRFTTSRAKQYSYSWAFQVNY